jgi:hypothetical protein
VFITPPPSKEQAACQAPKPILLNTVRFSLLLIIIIDIHPFFEMLFLRLTPRCVDWMNAR